MKNYKKVPEILTGKDLDYLKDIFGWNYLMYKECENIIENITDKEIITFITNTANMFYENLNIVLTILEKGDK